MNSATITAQDLAEAIADASSGAIEAVPQDPEHRPDWCATLIVHGERVAMITDYRGKRYELRPAAVEWRDARGVVAHIRARDTSEGRHFVAPTFAARRDAASLARLIVRKVDGWTMLFASMRALAAEREADTRRHVATSERIALALGVDPAGVLRGYESVCVHPRAHTGRFEVSGSGKSVRIDLHVSAATAERIARLLNEECAA